MANQKTYQDQLDRDAMTHQYWDELDEDYLMFADNDNDVSPEEQERLKKEFEIYCSLVFEYGAMTSKEDFLEKKRKFLKKIDKEKVFGDNTYWGSSKYYRKLEKYFPNYKNVISQKTSQIKSRFNKEISILREEISQLVNELINLIKTSNENIKLTEKYINQFIIEAQEDVNIKYKDAKKILEEYGKDRIEEYKDNYEALSLELELLISELSLNNDIAKDDIDKFKSLVTVLKEESKNLDLFYKRTKDINDIQSLMNLEKEEFDKLILDSENTLEDIKPKVKINFELFDESYFNEKMGDLNSTLSEYDKDLEKIKQIELERRALLEKRKKEALLRRKEYEEKYNYYVSLLSPFMGKEKAEQMVREFMPRPQTETSLSISDSVGEGGENIAKDVKKIQDFLIDFDYLSPSINEVSEVSDQVEKDPDKTIDIKKLTKTIEAIKKYQKYGATTKETIFEQDGKVDKSGSTIVSMRTMKKVQANYQFEKTDEEIPDVLDKKDFVTQARYGVNFGYKEDSRETEYINFIRNNTEIEDPANLYKADKEKIELVKKEYENEDFKESAVSKKYGLRMDEKEEYNKPNWVCCFDAAKAMLEKTNATPNYKGMKIQFYVVDIKRSIIKNDKGEPIKKESLGKGRYTNQSDIGIKYIDGQLKIGHAVFVGVDKNVLNPYNERVTDHFIVIIGKHKDSKGWYYTYFDPANSNDDSGYNTKKNRLYINTNKNSVESTKYKLSQIRTNED